MQIGIQQGLSPLLLAQKKGWFEEEFKKEGVKVKWTEFQSGPPYFEAIASNRLDFGEVGNSPVISAQEAGMGLTEIGLGWREVEIRAVREKEQGFLYKRIVRLRVSKN